MGNENFRRLNKRVRVPTGKLRKFMKFLTRDQEAWDNGTMGTRLKKTKRSNKSK